MLFTSITVCVTHLVKQKFRYIVDFSFDVEGASDDNKKDFLGEGHLLSQFNHPNILTLLGVVTVDDPVMLITPFMKNGDLQSFLTK